MQGLLMRYAEVLLTKLCKSEVCNRNYSVEQQLCRWLLVTLDRLPSDKVVMTQEMVAGMLGVRRESIAEAAGKLQQAGVIHGRRGHLTVLERAGLEKRVCECYGVVKSEFGRLLSDLRPREGHRAAAI